jgi:minor extracellular serine protease Vpr
MLLLALALALHSGLASEAAISEPSLFMVGTRDSAGLSRWLVAKHWAHRPFAQGLFEVQAHPDSLGELAQLPGIERIEAPTRQTHHSLDASRSRLDAQPVHLGQGLAHPYHGTGVLVGIIDVGFDLKHYAFLDSAGNSRIIRLWDHTNSTGTPPAGYQTGSLFSGAKLGAMQRSGSLSHHGTHVTGLAAGRTWKGSGGDWWGVADDARIALVECGSGCPQLGNGLEYLFKLADSLQLPAVVNMSWGSLNGPRDGKSSDCIRGASLLGPGKLAVVSAGNSGREAGHAVHSFAGDTARLALEVSAGIETQDQDTIRKLFFNEVELWGDSAKSYSTWVEFLDSATGTTLSGSPTYLSPTQWKNISEQNVVGNDTFWVSGNLEMRSGQGGARLSISTSRAHTALRVGILSEKATVHAWIWEEGLEFRTESPGRCRSCITPDHDQIISDKATCPQFISVGAIDGEDGSAADFTSRGPGRGVLPKPDVSAPGVEIISSLNSWVNDGTQVVGGAGTSFWGRMSGTSMAAPLVTGAVALLLETDPALTPIQAIAALKGASTTHDPATGWRSLDVLELFQEKGLQTIGIQKHSIAKMQETTSRAWITPTGTKIRISAGNNAMDSHPGGIAWLQLCSLSGCTSQGIVRP